MCTLADSGLQSELHSLPCQTLAIGEYYDKLESGGSLAALKARPAEAASKGVVEGWREVGDGLMEAKIALTGAQLRDLDAHLKSRCSVTLDDLQRKRLKRLADIRARGRVTSDEQCRFVLIRLDEIADVHIRSDEFTELQRLVTDYELVDEQHLQRKRRRT